MAMKWPAKRAAASGLVAATMFGGALFLGPTAVSTPAAAQTAAPTTSAPAPTAAQLAQDAARVAYEALPQAERVAIQTGLVWTGDYAGSLDGTFGRMTFEAITAFQKRHRFPADGVLDPVATKLLAETAAKKREAFGFQMITDKATGTRIGLPTRLLGKATKFEAGTRWASGDGRVEVRVFALPGQDLAALFERLKTEGPGQKVGYAVMRGDWFVVTDKIGPRQGYARFVRVGDGLRGFVIHHDPAVSPDFGRVVIATAGTFEPVAGEAPSANAPAQAPTTPTASATPTPTPTPTQPVAPKGIAATGLIVAPGRVLTAAEAVTSCRSLTVAGKAASVASADAGGGLALIAVEGATATTALRIAAEAPEPGARLTIAARSASGTTATGGEATATGLRAALQRGGLGAPAFDESGALAGVTTTAPDERRLVAGLVPSASYAAAGVEAVAAAVTAAGGAIDRAEGPALSSAGVMAAAGPRVVAIACER